MIFLSIIFERVHSEYLEHSKTHNGKLANKIKCVFYTDIDYLIVTEITIK